MNTFDRKQHWENIYQTKDFNQLSWYQPVPTSSLKFVKEFNLPKDAKIIDIGGGDSLFVDNLIELGFNDITVLDISAKAIEKAKHRLGDKAENVKWIICDAANFNPSENYDLWHDRAAFHFLTTQKEIANYVNTVNNFINANGYLVIGTFSEQGPLKCSGIEITQYSEKTMCDLFQNNFEKLNCIYENHKTPFDTFQNFIFCSFKKQEKE